MLARIWVYAEINQDRLMPITLELLARARGLGEVDVVALGQAARQAAATLGAHGARRVLVNEDPAFGNFIAELAVTENVQSFHLALFAAGGKVALGRLQDADQRKDDPAFEVLASAAQFPATLFDVRPMRQLLHNIPLDKLSSRDASLLYWADSYDVILCYREVTPAGIARPGN